MTTKKTKRTYVRIPGHNEYYALSAEEIRELRRELLV